MAVAEAITLPFTLTVVVTRLLETSPERAPPAVVVTLISPVFDSSPIFDLVSEEGDPWAASIVRIVSLRDKSTCGESSFLPPHVSRMLQSSPVKPGTQKHVSKRHAP
jgi:hypothetical protein